MIAINLFFQSSTFNKLADKFPIIKKPNQYNALFIINGVATLFIEVWDINKIIAIISNTHFLFLHINQ